MAAALQTVMQVRGESLTISGVGESPRVHATVESFLTSDIRHETGARHRRLVGAACRTAQRLAERKRCSSLH